jgi:hypothetical protein
VACGAGIHGARPVVVLVPRHMRRPWDGTP